MTDSSKTAPALSVFDFATMKHPYQAYRTLRDSDPVHFEPMLNVNVVTRYDLVREAIKDTVPTRAASTTSSARASRSCSRRHPTT